MPVRGIAHVEIADLSGTTASSVDSHPQKDLPLVHPVEEQPEHHKYGGALQQRLEAGSEDMEDAGAEVSAERLLDEALPQIGNKIGGDQVGAEHGSQ